MCSSDLAAALATGRLVYLGYNYRQQQAYTGKRSPFFTTVRYAATKDGKLLGMETDWTVDHGPYSEFGDLLTLRGAQYIGAGYDIPNIRSSLTSSSSALSVENTVARISRILAESCCMGLV